MTHPRGSCAPSKIGKSKISHGVYPEYFEGFEMKVVVISSEREKSFLTIFIAVGKRKLMNHFVVNLSFALLSATAR
jgi:hypothetical protein